MCRNYLYMWKFLGKWLLWDYAYAVLIWYVQNFIKIHLVLPLLAEFTDWLVKLYLSIDFFFFFYDWLIVA